MATEKPKVRKKYVGKAVASFLLVLFTMPLGHALMILMEHLLEPGTLHVCAFLMGAAGLLLTVAGVFEEQDEQGNPVMIPHLELLFVDKVE